MSTIARSGTCWLSTTCLVGSRSENTRSTSKRSTLKRWRPVLVRLQNLRVLIKNQARSRSQICTLVEKHSTSMILSHSKLEKMTTYWLILLFQVSNLTCNRSNSMCRPASKKTPKIWMHSITRWLSFSVTKGNLT